MISRNRPLIGLLWASAILGFLSVVALFGAGAGAQPQPPQTLESPRRLPPPVPTGIVGIATIFNGDISDFGFTYNFDVARVAVQNRFGRRVVLSDYVPGVAYDENFSAPSDDCKDVIRQLYANKYRLIMAPALFSWCVRWAHNEYTDLYLLLVGTLPDPSAYPRISTGYIRDWESRYASGILAGAATKTNKIGFVAPFTFPVISQYVTAFYLGARLSNPAVQLYVVDVGGFDNTTLQRKAAEDLVDLHGCDVLATNVNPLTVPLFAKERGLTSVFSDGDGRILVGESVLTSAMNSYAPLFIKAANMVVYNNWTRFDYNGGFDDGAAFLAFFGGSFWDNIRIRSTAEPILEAEIPKLIRRQSNGFCGVSALGLRTGNGTDCFPDAEVISWSLSVSQLPALFRNISYLGPAYVELNEVYVRYTDGVAIAFVILAIMLILIFCGLGIWTAVAVSRESKSLKYASPPFMYAILAGAILTCIAVIISNTPTDASCNATLWIVALGLNIMFSAIFAKAGRLWWILRNAKKMQKVTLPNRTLFIVLALQVLTLAIILVLGTTLSPYKRMSLADARLPANSVFVFCAATPNPFWPLSLVVYQGFLALLGIFFIFKTRNLFDELNESNEVALSIYNLLFVGAIVIILLYLVNLGPIASYAIQAIGMIWVAGTTVGLLYVPKLYEAITGKSFRDNSNVGSIGRGGTTKTEIERAKQVGSASRTTSRSIHQTTSSS